MEILKKKCCACTQEKPISEFHRDKAKKYGIASTCKVCARERTAKYRDNNLEHCILASRTRYRENKISHNENIRMYHNKKRREDPMFKLKSYLRTRLWKFFNKINKSKNTQKLLQCSWQEARNHLESKFQAGMTWENYGEWHVDHIIPLHSAKTIFELENLCKYLNLQPLWKSDHYTKTQKDRVLYGDT